MEGCNVVNLEWIFLVLDLNNVLIYIFFVSGDKRFAGKDESSSKNARVNGDFRLL